MPKCFALQGCFCAKIKNVAVTLTSLKIGHFAKYPRLDQPEDHQIFISSSLGDCLTQALDTYAFLRLTRDEQNVLIILVFCKTFLVGASEWFRKTVMRLTESNSFMLHEEVPS